MTDKVSHAERSRIMAAVKSKNTAPEIHVRRLVHRMGYRYRLHVKALPGTPDIVFPRLAKVISVSGCFWHLHGCPRCRIPASRRAYWVRKLQRNAVRDRAVRRELRRLGWDVLVVWECQLRRPDTLKARVARFLAAKRPLARPVAYAVAHRARRA
jgi:DNA mismatch endonuclease (patch repair protein)